MCLNNKSPHSFLACSDGTLDAISNTLDYYIDEILLKHHTTYCNCAKSIEKCVSFSQRYIINGRMFHSKAYKKRGLCNSYTIQYLNNNTSDNGKYFGEILVFFPIK